MESLTAWLFAASWGLYGAVVHLESRQEVWPTLEWAVSLNLTMALMNSELPQGKTRAGVPEIFLLPQVGTGSPTSWE